MWAAAVSVIAAGAMSGYLSAMPVRMLAVLAAMGVLVRFVPEVVVMGVGMTMAMFMAVRPRMAVRVFVCVGVRMGVGAFHDPSGVGVDLYRLEGSALIVMD